MRIDYIVCGKIQPKMQIEKRPVEQKDNRLPYSCDLCSEDATVEYLIEIQNCLARRRFCGNCLPSVEL
jgi:hypothetical protein